MKWRLTTKILAIQLQFPLLQEYLFPLISNTWPEHASAGVDIPLGVLAVNSGSKQKVSSGLPAAGLNGGWSSLLYSFCRKHRILEINPYRGLFGVCELMWNWSQNPFLINPLPIPSQPRASCWLLNTHTGLLVSTQPELALCPDTNIVGMAKTDGQ